MKMADSIITLISTCMAYWMSAIMSPTAKLPVSTRPAAHHTIATVAAFNTSEMPGMRVATRRATDTFVSAKSRLAFAKRASSKLSRRRARTTRTPVSCSRVTRFKASMRACSERRSGMTRRITAKASTTITGMAQNTMTDSSGLFA